MHTDTIARRIVVIGRIDGIAVADLPLYEPASPRPTVKPCITKE